MLDDFITSWSVTIKTSFNNNVRSHYHLLCVTNKTSLNNTVMWHYHLLCNQPFNMFNKIDNTCDIINLPSLTSVGEFLAKESTILDTIYQCTGLTNSTYSNIVRIRLFNRIWNEFGKPPPFCVTKEHPWSDQYSHFKWTDLMRCLFPKKQI